ncbi:MAG: adenylate/guanylate cyclase domain-containing protein [Rhodospirillales bacterium]|nr:adenylate/guanylate cyclase domain-containing protein [Rhodospirillales bacterium]
MLPCRTMQLAKCPSAMVIIDVSQRNQLQSASGMESPQPNPADNRATVSGRRLSAIAFVDIVGYGLLMGADEGGTVRRWMSTVDGILQPAAQRRGGTIIKSTGDGVLVEFPSVFDAVEWSQEVQGALRASDDVPPERRPLLLRISIHVGDVIPVPNDIFGDGVNIAARLQEYAAPGGIVISETAYGLLRGALCSHARDLGFLNLKHIEQPVRAYALDPAEERVLPVRPQQGALPSIAVLPLQNLNGDPADDYFADGVVEDIIVSLGGLSDLLVISRGSTLIYRGRTLDPREVGRTLGVRYVLYGSVRRSNDQIRVSIHLSNAQTGASMWSERLEVAPGELFEVQDRIVDRVVARIAPSVRSAELAGAMRKRPESFSAYDCTLRALDIMRRMNRETFGEARELLERAMADDPNFAMAPAWAARWHSLQVGQGWSDDAARDIARASDLAFKAIGLDRNNSLALATYGHLKSFLLHDCDAALVYLDRAITVAPNNALAWVLRSATSSYLGEGRQAVRMAERALRLSPFDHDIFFFYTFLSLAHFANANYADAVKWGRIALDENPSYTATLRILAAAHAANGQLEGAREIGRRLLDREPGFRLATYVATRQPFRTRELADLFVARLREAGLPE